MEADDEELMRRFQRGDQDAFETLVRRNLDFVIRHARRYLRDLAGAEDVAQAVFLRAWKSRDRFRDSHQEKKTLDSALLSLQRPGCCGR